MGFKDILMQCRLVDSRTGQPIQLTTNKKYKRLPKHCIYVCAWEDRICPTCSIIFKTRKSDKTKYCSKKCYHASRRKKLITHICEYTACKYPIVDRPMSYKKGQHIFCSNSCRAKYYKKQAERKLKALINPIYDKPKLTSELNLKDLRDDTEIEYYTNKHSIWGDDYSK